MIESEGRESVIQLPWDDDVKFICGMLCFECAAIAHHLRKDGLDIPPKAELEQAAVIRWMINLYLKHGANWRKVGTEWLNSKKPETA